MREQALELLASPLGRQFVFSLLGFQFTELCNMLDLVDPPVTVPLSSGPTPRLPSKRYKAWNDLPVAKARSAFSEMVHANRWAESLQLSESDLLKKLASQTMLFGFNTSDDWIWGLTAEAQLELLPVAEALLTCSASRHWWRPFHSEDQRVLVQDARRSFLDTDIATALASAMQEHRQLNATMLSSKISEKERRKREKKGARYGAFWWSTPLLRIHALSVGPFDNVPTIQTFEFVDSIEEETSDEVIQIRVEPSVKVYEITGPSDWQELVTRFPMDVTGTHDGEWCYWGGVPGPWQLPDWEAVSAQYDAVHVTVGGYLCTSGIALEVPNGYTMLAGWIPDATLWLAPINATITHKTSLVSHEEQS